MNRIKKLFQEKEKNILSIYITAGYPGLEDTADIVLALEKAGVNLIEVGMPYSDPLADGMTIQASSEVALKNGMTMDLVFDQVKAIRVKSGIPLIWMGYFNQVLQYGVERFIKACKISGIDGVIIPDLPMDIYETEYQAVFEDADLAISFLITPQTAALRIRKADRLTTAFVYVVSNAAVTGEKNGFQEEQIRYFERIKVMKLQNPMLIGFGISGPETFEAACLYANGAIIGSAFIRNIKEKGTGEGAIASFITGVCGMRR